MEDKIKFHLEAKKKISKRYSLGGQGQDPNAGLVGPLTQPPQLEGNGGGKFLGRMSMISGNTQ